MKLIEYQFVASHESGLIQTTCDAVTEDCEPVEAKLVMPWSRHKWQTETGEDRVADYAWVQVQTQMLCLDAPRGFVAVWFVNEGRRWFEVVPDLEFQDQILACAQRVWHEYVETKTLPVPTTSVELMEAWSPRIRKALAHVQVHAGEIVEATEQQGTFIEAWERAKAVGTKFTAAADAARDWIIAQMGHAEVLLLPDGRRYQRSIVSRKGYTVESGDHVELREVKQRKARRELTNGK